MARQEYTHLVRLAYETSSNRLRVTIPDRVGFASTSAYLYFRDARTLIVSPDPHKGAVHVNFIKQTHLDGCRELHWPDVRNIGPHFQVMPVHYRVEGRDLALEIPDEEHRTAPRRRGALKPGGYSPPSNATPDALARRGKELMNEDDSYKETVRIIGFGNDFEYIVPMDVMIRLIDELAKYRA